jgi:hypothetical protein
MVQVTLSKIFQWYGADFIGKTAPPPLVPLLPPAPVPAPSTDPASISAHAAVLHYIQPYLSADKRAALQQLMALPKYNVAYAPYDWSLNKS